MMRGVNFALMVTSENEVPIMLARWIELSQSPSTGMEENSRASLRPGSQMLPIRKRIEALAHGGVDVLENLRGLEKLEIAVLIACATGLLETVHFDLCPDRFAFLKHAAEFASG